MSTKLQLIFQLVLLSLLFFCVRLPSYHAPLFDEEGKFAILFVDRPPGPEYNLAARIDGKEAFILMRHPAPIYEILRGAGALGNVLLPNPPLSDKKVTPILRAMYSAFQLVLWGSLFLLTGSVLTGEARKLAFVLIAVVMISPIAAHTSCQLQTDSSVGVLTNGGFALAIFWFSRRKEQNFWSWAAVFCGAALFAMGKQEWTIVLFMALSIWLFLLFLQRRSLDKGMRPFLNFTAVAGSGLVVGHAFSFSYDPDNYWGGMALMWLLKHSAAVSGGEALTKWIVFFTDRLNYISTNFALLALGALALFIHRRRPAPYESLLILLGLGLFGAFFMTAWNIKDPRYFAPSIIVMTVACVALLPGIVQRRFSVVFWVLMGAMILHSAGFMVYQVRQNSRVSHIAGEIAAAREARGGVPYISSAAAWNKPEMDFVSSSMGWKEATKFVSKFGKVAVRVDGWRMGADGGRR